MGKQRRSSSIPYRFRESRSWSRMSTDNNDPNGRRLILPGDIHKRLFAYVSLSKGEISGFAKVQVGRGGFRDSDFTVTDAVIFNQECTGTHTELSDESLAQFYMKLRRDKQRPRDWMLWWHSHDDGSVFFSNTDEDTIKKLSKNARVVSLCMNKNGAMVARYDFKDESEILTPVVIPSFREIRRRVRNEVKRKVKYIRERGVLRGYSAYVSPHAVRQAERDYSDEQDFIIPC